MKNFILIFLTFVFLSACTLSPEEVALRNKELEIYATAMAKPTFTCTSGCEYTDPRRNISLAKDTNGWDFANTLVKTTANVAMSAAPYVALGAVAIKGINNAGGNTHNADSYNSHSEANQQETVSGIKAGNDVDQSQQNQNNPVNNESTTDNNSVNDSNNSNDDNSTEIKEAVEAPIVDETPEPDQP